MFKKKSSVRHIFFRATCDALRPAAVTLGILIFMMALSGCQMIPPLPPVNLSAPGWSIRQGQAVWRNKKDAPELAGELLVAVNPDGRSFVQFTKTPLPFLVAQTVPGSWEIHFVPNNKTYSAHGHAPARLPWLHLADCLGGTPPPKNWQWERLADGGFRLQNPSTGELLEGYLNP